MKRDNALFLIVGLCGGLLLGLLLAFFAFRPTAGSTAAPTPQVTATEPTAPAATPSPATSPEGRPQWEAERVYNGGDEVLYQERIYRAKWWTQGETPGEADVWENTLETPGQAEAGPLATPLPEREPVEKPQGFKVVGYYPSWSPEGLGKVRFDVLTHINYAFAIPTAEGGLLPLENPDTARALIETAHARGVKVLLAVGGWSYNDVPLEATFVSATETETKRAAFAQAIIAMCDQYGFDGVDMDWEHPRLDGGTGQQYEALMLTLAEELHGAGKLLTSAVLSGATADGNIYYDAAAHSDRVLEAVDWINVMAYDGGDGERHSPYDFAVSCGSYWKDTRGLAGEKVVLGVPFYARPSWAGYGTILTAVPEAAQGDHVTYNGMEVWYNGPETIQDKTRYAMKELGGVMIWELTQDSGSTEDGLQEAIGRTMTGAE